MSLRGGHLFFPTTLAPYASAVSNLLATEGCFAVKLLATTLFFLRLHRRLNDPVQPKRVFHVASVTEGSRIIARQAVFNLLNRRLLCF
jgi:hypothetical protein